MIAIKGRYRAHVDEVIDRIVMGSRNPKHLCKRMPSDLNAYFNPLQRKQFNLHCIIL